MSTEWLIQNHYLAPYKYYGVQLADASKLHTKADWDACYEKTMGIIDRCKEDMKSGIHKEYWEGD